MIAPERQAYIEESKNIARKYFEEQNMLVCYVRKKRPGNKPTGCKDEQTKAIRSLLNLAGAKIPAIPALRIINESLPTEMQFPENKESVVKYEAVRKNWLSRKSQIVGVIVAFKTGNEPSSAKIGWSLCHECDSFNRHIGMRRAIKYAENVRVVEQSLATKAIPHTLSGPVAKMMSRAARIFNGK